MLTRAAILGLALVFSLAVAVAGCSSRKACQSANECSTGEACVYFHDDSGLRCAVVCEDNSECPDGQICKVGASTCKTCQDMLRVCK